MDGLEMDVEDPGVPAFETLAPLLDRLRELAAEELSDPQQVTVQGWDDGTFTAFALHTVGPNEREEIRYLREQEAFEYRHFRVDGESEEEIDDEPDHWGAVVETETTVFDMRRLESYPSPV